MSTAMDRVARSSLSGDESSDYESVLTEPASPSDDKENVFLARFDAEVDKDRKSQSSVAKLALQVQKACAAGSSGAGGGVNSPQLNPFRPLQVIKQDQLQHRPTQAQVQQWRQMEQLRQQQLAMQRFVQQQHALRVQQYREQQAQEQLQEAARHQHELNLQRQQEQQQQVQQQQVQQQQVQQQQVQQQQVQQQQVQQQPPAEEEAYDAEGRPLKFKCRICPAKFTHINLLNRHSVDQHPVEKPHVCTDCGRGYVHKEVMEAHQQMVHRGERPFPCDQCQKVFSRREYLQTHSRVHTGYKPYTCPSPLCMRRFAWKSCIDIHIRTHTGERPYLCTTCYKDFNAPSTLKMHEMIHTNSFPFPCTYAQCNRRFRRSGPLKEHLVNDHQEDVVEEIVGVPVNVPEQGLGDVTQEEADAAVASVVALVGNEALVAA